MILDIDEETCVASIELPKQNLAPAYGCFYVYRMESEE